MGLNLVLSKTIQNLTLCLTLKLQSFTKEKATQKCPYVIPVQAVCINRNPGINIRNTCFRFAVPLPSLPTPLRFLTPFHIFFMAVAVYMAFGRSIFDFYVPHNAVCFPLKILHKNSFQTLLGVAIVSSESEHKPFLGKTNWIIWGTIPKAGVAISSNPVFTHNPDSQHCLKSISIFIVFGQLISSTLQHQSRRKLYKFYQFLVQFFFRMLGLEGHTSTCTSCSHKHWLSMPLASK